MEEWLRARYILALGMALSAACFWTVNLWPFGLGDALLGLVWFASSPVVCLLQPGIAVLVHRALDARPVRAATGIAIWQTLYALISVNVVEQGTQVQDIKVFTSESGSLAASYAIYGRFIAVLMFASSTVWYFITAFEIDALSTASGARRHGSNSNALHELSERHKQHHQQQHLNGGCEVAAHRTSDVLQPDAPAAPASETQPDGGVPAAPAAGVRRSARAASAKVKAR